ncbi:MAG: NAD(P)H-hydrate dehydratase, partial [Deltaproteobacteria bacterium]|nr:NAD(P)H-hydrate dehydratase [Deltaproteobacteria bacterium]
QVMGLAVQADLTVTFGAAKVGQAVQPGLDCCGDLAVIDIGIPDQALAQAGLDHYELEAWDAAAAWPKLPPEAHKGTAGHLLILAGSPGKTGAACLVAEGALRAGAGLATCGCPASLNPILEAKLTEAMTEPLAETAQGTLGPESVAGLAPLLEGKTALALGPGLSTRPEVKELVDWVVHEANLPLVIDADGLNLLAPRPEVLKETKKGAVLTPHPGEMARLLKSTPAQIQADRLGAARTLAQRSGQVVILKGARSIVASPEGQVFINPTGNPGLASGGTGDVLTGLIGGLLAQGLSPLQAAQAGVYVHGLAADLLWQETGGRGFLASEVARAVPLAVRSLVEDV